MFRWIGRILAACLAIFLIYNLWVFGHILYWRNNNPDTSAFMRERLSVMRQENPDAQISHQWVSYSQISNNLKHQIQHLL